MLNVEDMSAVRNAQFCDSLAVSCILDVNIC